MRAEHQQAFPVMGSLQEVIQYGEAHLPVLTKNSLKSLLMTYHNTLLHTLAQQKDSQAKTTKQKLH